jgi:hypothetical protein
MNNKLSNMLERISEFFATRKGMLPLIGLGLVLVNFILQLFVPGWLTQTNFLLHLGLIFAILGFLLAWAL